MAKKRKSLVGWQRWNKNKLPEGVVEVMFMNSKIFPKGAIVQADVSEVLCGVIGDKNPTFWRKFIEEN